MSKTDRFVARHVLEIRLDNRVFSFMDYRGLLVDFLIKETDGHRIKIAENRVDVADQEMFSKSVFFSWENFGFQIEAKDDFDSYHQQVDHFLGLVTKFHKYSFGSIVRIGTKSTIFYHKYGQNFEGLKEIFTNNVMNEHNSFEKSIGAQINDVAYVADIFSDEYKVNFKCGPMTFAEAIAKEFGPKPFYDGFKPDNSGVFMDIDLYQAEKMDLSVADLAKKIHSNVDSIERIMNGFISYLFAKTKNEE